MVAEDTPDTPVAHHGDGQFVTVPVHLLSILIYNPSSVPLKKRLRNYDGLARILKQVRRITIDEGPIHETI